MKVILKRSKLMFCGRGFWISLLAVIFLSMSNTILTAWNNRNLDVYQTVKAPFAFILYGGSGGLIKSILQYTYIFLLLLPFCFSFVRDNKLKISSCLVARMGIRKYHYGNLFCCFLGSFLIFFIPFTAQILVNQVVFETKDVHSYLYNYLADISGDMWSENIYNRSLPFKWLYINHIQLYNLFYAFLFSLMAGIMSGFIYSISYYVKQYGIILVLPLFVLEQLQNKMTELSEEFFGKQISFLTSDYLMVNNARGLCVWYILGLTLMLVGISLFIVEYQCRKDQV